MKLRIANSIIAALAALNINAQAIVSDPTVAAAITLDMTTQKDIQDDTKKAPWRTWNSSGTSPQN